jgi:hypothetical protein
MINDVLDILTKINDRLTKLEDKVERFSSNHDEDKAERRIYFFVLLFISLFLVVGVSYENGAFSFKGTELTQLIKVLGSSAVILLIVNITLKRVKK